MTDPKDVLYYVNASPKLTDDAFESSLHDLGFRVALWWFRYAALKGDLKLVNSLERYITRVELFKSRQVLTKPRVIGTQTFIEAPRAEEPNTTD